MTQAKTDTTYSQFQNEHAGYDQPQAGYGQPSPQVVVQPTAQIQNFSVEVSQVRWSWCSLVTSIFALCCCQLFGFIALLATIFSYVDHKSKDFERARHKRSIAYGFGIAGIVIGSMAIIGAIIFAIVMATAATEAVSEGINKFNDDYNG